MLVKTSLSTGTAPARPPPRASVAVVGQELPALCYIFGPLVVVPGDGVRLVGVDAVAGLCAPRLNNGVTSENLPKI